MTPSVKRLRRNLWDCSEKFSPSDLDRLSWTLPIHQVKGINRDWRMWGRLGKQLPPDEFDWRSWLILGGRGAGKTRAGAEWVKAQALGDWTDGVAQARRIAIVGPTLEQARSVMIEGKSGLLSIHMEAERPLYEPSKRLVTWPNGAIAQVFSADEPEMGYSPKDMEYSAAKDGAAREIALAFGVPRMLLGIPGDNTFANFMEANRSFWRQTVLPMASRMAEAMTGFLCEGGLRLAHDLDQVEALAADREALWARVGKAEFLTDDEKRQAVGYGAVPSS